MMNSNISDICPISGETRVEELVNHWTHRIGLLLSLVGLPILVLFGSFHGDMYKVIGYSIFGVSLVLLYVASTYYHGCTTLEVKQRLRTLDHACIYLLIAGTYTPFILGPLKDPSGWVLLVAEWSIAVTGIFFKIFAFDRTRVISLIAYLVMGWLIVLWWSQLGETVSWTTCALVVVGGGSYTFGVIFFLWESLPFNHAVWHLFVLAGSVSHYCAVLLL